MIEIKAALKTTQKIMQSERRRESTELRDAKSFPNFAVTPKKLSQPLVQDDSSTAALNPETLNVTK
jgi:hypothetical protein